MTRARVGLASAAFAIHLVDHLVAREESGLLFAGAIALGLACIGLTAAYGSLPPAVRGTGAILFGAILLYGGTTYHLAPMWASAAGSGTPDGTGLLATLGSVLMITAGSSETWGIASARSGRSRSTLGRSAHRHTLTTVRSELESVGVTQ